MLQEQATSSLPSSSERSSSSGHLIDIKEGMESDEDARRVPEFGQDGDQQAAGGDSSASGRGGQGGGGGGGEEDRGAAQSSSASGGQRRRGKSPADREHKRLKRLLRNRVSAQQARERKKAYMSELEAKVKELEGRNSELEERVSTLQNENNMLRQILKNTTGSRRGSFSGAASGQENN